jgi:hypothetical protein
LVDTGAVVQDYIGVKDKELPLFCHRCNAAC